MWTTFRTFFKEIFQDVDDGFSAKRTAFFIFVALIAMCVIVTVFWKAAVPAMIWDGLVDLVKWIGAAILGERAPAALAALTSGINKTPVATPAPAPAPVPKPKPTPVTAPATVVD